jgi:signal transduction histidine kinase/putative methionine-R-sulfoxide reductase with GAF domain
MRRGANPAKAKGESKRPVARKSRKRESSRVGDLEKRLAEALKREAAAREQHTATSAILRVISDSRTDAQPVFDVIVRNAARLCDAVFSGVALRDGDQLTLPAAHGLNAADLKTFLTSFPIPLGPDTVSGRAILEGRVVHVRDQAAEPAYARSPGQRVGTRSIVTVPMLRNGRSIGAISAFRREVRPFTDKQIALLKTFADQAVIAIENVRLFNETREALEQQTATAEILRVISSSPTDVQPVFSAILANALRLCRADQGGVFTFDGHAFRVATISGEVTPEFREALASGPIPPGRETPLRRVALERRPIQVADIQNDRGYSPPRIYRAEGMRTSMAVPLLKEGKLIGALAFHRREVRPFTEQQMSMVETFADQAVIAIENVRLFTEIQTSNRELTTALDTQTATSDILRVISRSQTDVQPVFDAIVASAVRLLGAYSGTLTRIAGEQIELAAITSTSDVGDAALRARFPQPLSSAGPHARTIRDRAPLNIADAHTDPRLPEAVHAYARVRGYRSQVAVPMLRYDEAIGTISLTRGEPGGFTDEEVLLLQTFADQAVIAIENVRLFNELQARTQQLTRSVEQLTALREVGHAVSSSLDLETVLNTIVARAVQLAGAHSGTIWEYDAAAEEFVLRITQNVEDAELRANPNARVRRGEGAVGRLAVSLRPVQIPDITHEGAYEGRLRDSLVSAGTRALLAIPLLHEDQLLGGLVISRRTPGEFPAEVVDLLASFATQSALALQNARLFLEIEDKSRQLEAASQHKSEFLANMSHELRTPLNAVIGFSEVLRDRMFGELNEKQEEYLNDIHASGQHLLSLINDILDLSKIEAGRMELALADFDLPTAIDNALTLVRERAGRRGITLGCEIDEPMGMIQGDERKMKQVLLNLLSNALKFTPEGGRIDVRTALKKGTVEISVTDTGVGIAPEDQEAIFEEFRQVGTSDKKVEGTGLGLALSRRFVELHGGRIWVRSQKGVGSTFTFTIPVQRADQVIE